MSDIRVMIVEDDPGMRLVLRRIIEKEEGYTLIAEVADGLEAVRLAAEWKPDAVFLDIELPGIDGLGAAREICAQNERLAVIFATGHDEFMSDAFELYAFDYILKPFDHERIRRTLTRLRETIRSSGNLRPATVRRDRLTLKSRDGILFIDPETIVMIERVGRESVLTLTDGEVTTSEGLSELAARLDPALFLRSHRSYIVNAHRITRAVPYGRWTHTLYLRGTGKTALITAEKLAEL